MLSTSQEALVLSRIRSVPFLLPSNLAGLIAKAGVGEAGEELIRTSKPSVPPEAHCVA